MIVTRMSDEDEVFFDRLKSMTEDELRATQDGAKAITVAYACAPELRTEAQKILVQEHEQWKNERDTIGE